jgi:hypothetical protein
MAGALPLKLPLHHLFLMLPIYWLINMSFKTNERDPGRASRSSRQIFTLDNYIAIFTDPTWYMGLYQLDHLCDAEHGDLACGGAAGGLCLLALQLPRRQALFFWLLTNRMAPPAVFALPFFQLYSAVGLFDTHIAVALAHCLFNVPLAVWILEGFMRGVPKEIDETAYVDGYSFPRFFVKIFMPLIAGHRRRRLLLLHVLLGGTAAGQDADRGRRQADRRHHDPHRRAPRATIGAAGGGRGADHHARRARDLFRAQLHRQGLCPGLAGPEVGPQPYALLAICLLCRGGFPLGVTGNSHAGPGRLAAPSNKTVQSFGRKQCTCHSDQPRPWP